jgi:aspartyl-tRNA(Asn)/glutamyl-tRNA(Gln) amidotransferase subunit A
MLDAIAGYDALDVTSVDWPTEPYAIGLKSHTELRIGVVREPFFEGLDSDIKNAMNESLNVIGKMATDIDDVDLPAVPTAVQAPEVYAVHAEYFRKSPELYRGWMRERLKQAAAIDTVSYIRDRHELDRVRRNISDVFEKVDLLITPTVPVPPITIEAALQMTKPPLEGELWLRNTRPFNAYGLPTISIPCGFTKTGLPIGLQIAGPQFGEVKLLAFAQAFEQATDWHTRVPAL